MSMLVGGKYQTSGGDEVSCIGSNARNALVERKNKKGEVEKDDDGNPIMDGKTIGMIYRVMITKPRQVGEKAGPEFNYRVDEKGRALGSIDDSYNLKKRI